MFEAHFRCTLNHSHSRSKAWRLMEGSVLLPQCIGRSKPHDHLECFRCCTELKDACLVSLLPLLYENAFVNPIPVRVNQICRKEKIIFVSLFALTPSKDKSKLNFSVKGCSESRHDNALISITMFSFVCLKRAVFLIDRAQLIPSESWVNSGVHSPIGSFHFLSHLHATLSLYSNWFFLDVMMTVFEDAFICAVAMSAPD